MEKRAGFCRGFFVFSLVLAALSSAVLVLAFEGQGPVLPLSPGISVPSESVIGVPVVVGLRDAEGLVLVVRHGNESSRYVGLSGSSFVFRPSYEGFYELELLDLGGNAVAGASVSVLSGDVLYMDKEFYSFGEQVRLRIVGGSNYSVRIESGRSVYSFMGAAQGDLVFKPVEAGNYSVVVESGGSVVARKGFVVARVSGASGVLAQGFSVFDKSADAVFEADFSGLVDGRRTVLHRIFGLTPIDRVVAYVRGHEDDGSFRVFPSYKGGDVFVVRVASNEDIPPGDYELVVEAFSGPEVFSSSAFFSWVFTPALVTGFPVTAPPYVNHSFELGSDAVFSFDFSELGGRTVMDWVFGLSVMDRVSVSVEGPSRDNVSASVRHLGLDNFSVSISRRGAVQPGIYSVVVVGRVGDETVRRDALFNWGLSDVSEVVERINSLRSSARNMTAFRFDIRDREGVEAAAQVKVFSTDLGERLKVVRSDAPSFIEEGRYDVDMSLVNSPVESVRFSNISLGQGMGLGIDEVEVSSRRDAPQNSLLWKKVYAVDPSLLDFSVATVTAVAQGTELFKCRDWNFSSAACMGSWVKLMDIVPGQQYSFTINSTDPGFGESIPIPLRWYNESLSGEQIKVMICRDFLCNNLSSNFQVGDVVYLQVNTSPEDVGLDSENSIAVYPGSSTTSVAATAWNCTNSTGGANPDFGMCYSNFTVQVGWSGWYYIDSRTRGGGGNTRHNFKTPITVGSEPVSGYSLRFFRDNAYTVEGDVFNSSEMVYVEFSTGSAAGADSGNSDPTLINFHRGAVGGSPEPESYSSTVDPYRLNFSMPALTDGNWYYFEPRLRDASNARIPAGADFVHGRMVLYKSNLPVNVTNVSTDSPDTDPKQINQNVTFYANFTDLDDVDRHRLLVCRNSTVYSNLTCNGTTHCITGWNLGSGLNCSKTLSLSDPVNETAFLIVCDVRSNCSSKALRWGVFKDVVSPVVVLNRPADGNLSSDNTVDFNYTPSDNGNMDNCSLWTNETGSFARVASNSSAIVNSSPNIITRVFGSNGRFVWNVQCIDSYGNAAFNSTNYTITIDAPPIVSLMEPLNDSWKLSSSVSFRFNVSAAASISNCSLVLDGTVNTTNTTVSLDAATNFSFLDLADGFYNWSVNCTTVFNDTGSSKTRLLKVDTLSPVASFVTPTPTHDGFVNGSGFVVNVSHTESNPATIVFNLSGQLLSRSYSGTFTNVSFDEVDDGDYNFSVALNDSAGNSLVTETRQVHVDASTVKTYNDSTYLFITRSFLRGSTVFSRLVNGTNSSNYSVEYWKPSATAYAYRTNFTRSSADGNATANITFSLTDSLGTWSLLYLSNPQYFKWKTLTRHSPSTGQQANGVSYDQAFYLLSRDDGNITTTQAQGLEIHFQRVDPASPTSVWGPNAPTTGNNWAFSSGTYTRSYTPGNNRLFMLRVTAHNASVAEPPDQYVTFLESIDLQATGSQSSDNADEPSKLVVRNLSYGFIGRQVTVQFDIYKLDYSTKITSFGTSPTWMVNASEASDYDSNGVRTVYQGTTPAYNSSTGYWESQLNITKPGKYSVQVQLVSATNAKMKPKHGIILSRAASNRFDLTQAGTSLVLNTPVNLFNSSSRSVSFNFTPTDTLGFKNCSVFTNQTGSWRANISNTTLIDNGNPNFLNITFDSDGSFLWNVICSTSSDINITDDSNRTVFVDTAPPFVFLFGPANNTLWTNSSVVDFEFNVSDLSAVSNCSLIANDVVLETLSSVAKSQKVSVSSGLDNGNYNWSVNCTDFVGLANQSLKRNLTVSVMSVAWNGSWFESSSSSCSGSPCSISLLNSRDGVGNLVSRSIASQSSGTMSIAASPYMGGSVLIPLNSVINMSGVFLSTSANAYGFSFASFFLYVVNSSGQFLLTQYGNNGTDGVVLGQSGDSANTLRVLSGTNTTGQRWVLSGTDKLKLDVSVFNQHTSALTFEHHWDGLNRSLVNITGFYFLGSVDANVSYPPNNLTVINSQVFNVTCNVSCSMGHCLNTTVYVQRNVSGGWSDVGSTGNIILNGSETASHFIGNISSYQPYTESAFFLYANTPSPNLVRCIAVSDFSSANGSNTSKITVTDTNPPTISLVSPANNSYDNFTVDFLFTPTDLSSISGCDLIIDEVLNKSSSSISNGAQNNITTVTNMSEGVHAWSVNCTDDTGNMNQSAARNVLIDNTKPFVNLSLPANNTIQSALSVRFNFTVFDNTANASCDLIIDSLVNASDINASNSSPVNVTVTDFSGGVHYWNVSCADAAGNTNVSKVWQFRVNDTPPVVSLSSPAASYWDGDGLVNFSYLPADDIGFNNCSLYISGVLNQTNASIANNASNNFTVSGLPDGLYNWSVDCYDSSSQPDSTQNRSFFVDAVRPTINLTSPSSGNITDNSSVAFRFIPYDNMNSSMACNLTVNGTLRAANFSASNGSVSTRVVSNLSDGIHYWNVSCWDSVPNSNSSETRNVTVNESPSVTLDSPASGSLQVNNVTLFFSASDNDGFTNCSLYIDSALNQSKPSASIVRGQNNFTVGNMSAGLHTWNVSCYDNGSFVNFGEGVMRNFTVDLAPPSVSLNLPSDNITFSTGNVTFNWTASDNNDSSLLCNLTLAGQVNQSAVVSPSGSLASASVNNINNGDHLWNVSCWDDAGNADTSITRTVKVRIGPLVSLDSPVNGYWDSDGNITFVYTPSSNTGDGFNNCSLYLDDVQNQTNFTIADDGQNLFDVFWLPDRNYTWKVECYDTFNASSFSQSRAFSVDSTAPVVSINSPLNSSNLTYEIVNMSFLAIDNMDSLMGCNVTVNGTVFIENASAQNGTNISVYSSFGDGLRFWNVSCIDDALNVNFSQSLFFSMNRSPEISVSFPVNGTWHNVTNATVLYRAFDNDNLTNCSVVFDSAINQTATNVTSNSTNNFTLADISEGLHTLYVECVDNGTFRNRNVSRSISFYVDVSPPNVTLSSPALGFWSNFTDVLFNFTAVDLLASSMACNLTINSSILVSNISAPNNTAVNLSLLNLTDALYSWNVSCVDSAYNVNVSETRLLNMSVSPSVYALGPANWSWVNTLNMSFNYTVSDNDVLGNCSLVLNSTVNQTNYSVPRNANVSFYVSAVDEGSHNWSVVCVDNGTYRLSNYSVERFFTVDYTRPWVLLSSPVQGFVSYNSTIDFNFTVFDNFNDNITCNLTVGGVVNLTRVVRNGTSVNETVSGFSAGTHLWNVTCLDTANNTNVSITGNFTVPKAQLQVHSSGIFFNVSSFVELAPTAVFANISNTGGVDALNFTVRFVNGSSQISSLLLNLSHRSNTTLNVSWLPPVGFQNVSVIVDSINLVPEDNESDNNATVNVSVPLWHTVYGNVSGTLLISMNSSSLFVWNVTPSSNGNIYVADLDSSFRWVNATPLGINATGSNSSGDFEELDSAFGTSGLSDSVNATFTSSGRPSALTSFVVFNRQVGNVPSANSTNSTDFLTGILWDASDSAAAGEYNGSQDVVFISNINESLQGKFGVYDFEVRVPSKLRAFKGPDPVSVVFYVELK